MPNRFVLLSLLMGGALIVIGSALIFHPLGFIVSGGFLLAVARVANKGRNQ
jgi:hypothetical protein